MDDIKLMNIVDIELNSGNLHRSWLNHSIGTGDAKANCFGVRLFRDGEAVSLTGGSVQGFFRNSHGENIAITSGNTISGNVAYVVLPQACYNYEGQFTLAIKVINSSAGVTGTMRIVDGVVNNTNTGNAVAPTGTVPTYQEVLSVYNEMVAAKEGSVRFDEAQSLTAAQKKRARLNIDAASLEDTIAPTYSESEVYAVGTYCSYNGSLYRCKTEIATPEPWTSSHWKKVVLGPDVGEVADSIRGDIAPTYSTSEVYAVGDYRYHKGVLYRCIKKIQTPKSWSSTDWEEAVLGTEVDAKVNELKSTIGNLYTLEYKAGAYINSNGKVYLHTTGTSAVYKGTVLQCDGYSSLTVKTYCGNGKPILVADKDNNILSEIGTGSSSYTVLSTTVITIPANGYYLYVNCNSDNAYQVTIEGINVRTEIDRLGDHLTQRIVPLESLSDDVDFIEARMDGTDVVLDMISVPKMIGSDGTEKTETSTLKFFQINDIDKYKSVHFSFEHSPSGAGVHYFNQYDSHDTLLQYQSFNIGEGDNKTYTPTLESNVSYIKVSVWTSNGTVTTKGTPKGAVYSEETVKVFSKVSALGDSITAGYCPSGNVTDTYQKLIADRLGATYQKLGVVSTPICPNSDLSSDKNAQAFVYRYTDIASDADLIIIAGGTNDFRHNVPLGTDSDTASQFETSFYGAMEYLLQNIISNHIGAKIVFVTPFHQWQDTVANSAGHKLTDYIGAIKTVCERYGVDVIDGYAKSGINKVSAFATVMIPDYIHPTAEGHMLIYKNLMPYFAML